MFGINLGFVLISLWVLGFLFDNMGEFVGLVIWMVKFGKSFFSVFLVLVMVLFVFVVVIKVLSGLLSCKMV